MANWLTYRIEVGDDVLVLADEEAQELIKNETERSKKADAQTASFLESTTTNGIIRNSKSDPFGQTAIGGMKVVIDKGDLIINGNIKNHARLTRTYNVTQENRTEVFLYRFDSVTNEITGLWRDCIIQGDIILSREDKTELPLRSSGYYDILICKITIPAGATEITQDMIGDFRQNEYYCGYAKNILVEIDDTLTKSDAAADAAAVGTVISDLRKETRTRDIITEKRITNLEAGLPAERWSVDDSVAYTKDVPENALPFASVDMIGGMTRKCTNLIRSTAVSTTRNGVTFTVNSDGSVALNGTATRDIYYDIGESEVASGEYTLSCPNAIAWASCILFCDQILGWTSNPAQSVRTLDGGLYSFKLFCATGYKYNNVIIRSALNEGSTAIPYEPYFDGLRSAPVTEVESVGANLFDTSVFYDSTYYGVKFVNNGDGSLTATGTNTLTTVSIHREVLKVRLCAGTYTMSGARGENAYIVTAYKKDGTTTYLTGNGSLTIDTEQNVLIYWQIKASATVADTIRPMLNNGSTALPYTPYRRNTIPVPAEVQALDGYGWGVNADCYNYIDWEKKQFVKRIKRLDMGSLDWAKNKDYQFYAALPENSKVAYALNHICSKYTSSSKGAYDSPFQDKSVSVLSTNVWVYDKDYNAATALKAAMSGVWLYYELATPVITDILPDDNLICVEGGGTVTMVNEYGYDVPSEITYQLKGAEA